MPIISGLQTSLVGDANTAFTLAFFPRFIDNEFVRTLCGTTRSSRDVEPFALAGSAPVLRRYSGSMKSQDTNSWKLQVPNLLYKSIEDIARREFELDQTATIRQRMGQHGVRVAQHPSFMLAKRILTGAVSGSQNQTFEGQTYTTTFDAQPIFSTSHNHNGSNQSNIVTGSLPNTVAGITGQDIAVTVNQLLKDLQALEDQIAGVVDDKNVPIYPDLEINKSLVVVVPPVLREAAELAFNAAPGATVGGTSGSSSGSTTLRAKPVKKILSPGLIKGGFPDIESDDVSATVSPVNPTDWYAFIVDDFVKPWYWQRFRPKKPSETIPLGQNPEAQAAKALAAANQSGLKVTPEALDVYAATEIATNLGALGSNAQRDVVENEKFFVSARTRGNMIPGPWFTCWRVKCNGGS